jgi:hypothetical protein
LSVKKVECSKSPTAISRKTLALIAATTFQQTANMKKFNLIFAIIFGLSAFGQAQHTKEGKIVSRQEYLTVANRQTIKGTWAHPKWTAYQFLNFKDSIVYMANNIDTIMPSKYSIVGDTLILFGGQPIKPYKSKILLLRKDTLVLQGILGTKEILGYSRKKSKK